MNVQANKRRSGDVQYGVESQTMAWDPWTCGHVTDHVVVVHCGSPWQKWRAGARDFRGKCLRRQLKMT